ncbi:cation diffusion facilitator family transporter [Flavobacterium sp. GT3R68]|uniref:cation diffusion facilitator family transporter n=1 Tax=Flavobacterium sp. GT3R68 TaxID=2594437 RepID=UPI000F86FCFD|nr:cation diffusion facilitator family transporter [Flavobacterium sp. GT3R68]RTY95895.1 cation transporter [Flavobacterium sp. GSN2]TRW93667.1 cation transporter [Flavobacterium sp. GT3R68]
MMHSHSHVHIHKHEVKGKNLLFSIVLNVIITVAQVVGGIVSGSLALISDALHNFSDVLSLVFTYIAHKLSRKKASINQTFGFKRAELIAAFINSMTLIVVAIYLIIEATQRFLHPEPIGSTLVIWMSILGIAANGFSALLLKGDADKNLNMKSAYLHLFTDMMASVAVLIGGLLMKYFSWFWVDSVMTLIIAVYLIIVGVDLLKSSTKMLMLFTPAHIDIKEIVREVHKIPGVNKLHHIHVWHLNDEELHLEAHLDCQQDIKMSEFNALLHEVEQVLFHKFHINHINIQPEYNKEDPKDYIVQD